MLGNRKFAAVVWMIASIGVTACDSDSVSLGPGYDIPGLNDCATPGEFACTGDIVVVCKEGRYVKAGVTEYCRNGTYHHCTNGELEKQYCRICGTIDEKVRCLECQNEDDCNGNACVGGLCSGDKVWCHSTCTVVGELTCDGAGYRTCMESEGCLYWSDITLCKGGEKCNAGICGKNDEPCSNACEAGKHQCAGDAANQECKDTNNDGCTEWAAAVPCDEGEVCSDGNCIDNSGPCSNACAAGAKQCTANIAQECKDTNGDGCTEWENIKTCEIGESCSGGECIPDTDPCSNACNSGDKQCSGNTVQECKDTNGDGCTEWSNVQDCTGGQVCSQGSCQNSCSNACAAGAKQCAGNEAQECKDTNGDGCTEWSTVKTCSNGETCSAGSCIQTAVNVPVRYLATDLHSPITPYVVTQMKNIAAKSSNKRSNVFMKIGDSHYDYDFDGQFMKCFSNATSAAVTLDGRTELQAVIDAFQSTTDSFNRNSEAAEGGMATRYSFLGSPTHLSAEISAMMPRFAFFGHGSNDMGNGSYCHTDLTCPSGVNGYAWALQDYYRQINKVMDQLVGEGIIPLISGITPRNDKPSNINYIGGGPIASTSDYPTHMVSAFNAVTRGNAEAMQVPFFNVHKAVVNLSNNGLRDDNMHTSVNGSACNFTASGLQYGANQRNLGSIQMLNKAWNVVVNNQAAPDNTGMPFEGSGSSADPYIVSSIPFTHSANTKTGGANLISAYAGKCPNYSECGNEYYYKMVLNERKRLRMFAVSATGVDADIQILREQKTADACIARNDIMVQGTFAAGTYYITVDSYCTNGSPTPGKYLLGIVECDSDDNNCNTAY